MKRLPHKKNFEKNKQIFQLLFFYSKIVTTNLPFLVTWLFKDVFSYNNGPRKFYLITLNCVIKACFMDKKTFAIFYHQKCEKLEGQDS